jgi:peptidoglycan/LPS O-acetylase OafA/YrhL
VRGRGNALNQLAPKADEEESIPAEEPRHMPSWHASAREASGEIPSLTPLRGVAALFVVAFHLRFYIPNLHYEQTAPLFMFGYLWVDFFFILSGFIIAHVYGPGLERGLSGFAYTRFLYLRWCRIYPLHAAVLALFVAFELIAWALHASLAVAPGFEPFSRTHTVVGIATHLLLINSLHLHDKLLWNFPAWSISAEWIAYLAFPVLALALQRRPALVSWLSFVALLGLLNLLALTNGGRLALHHDWGAVRCLLEFSMGILVHEAYQRRWLDSVFHRDTAFALTLSWILFAMGQWLRDILIVPAFAALLLCAARNDRRVKSVFATRSLRHLGEISYSIYMVNILIFQIVHFVWFAVGWGVFGVTLSVGASWMVWLAAMALVIAASHASHRWIEKPARAWLRRRSPFGSGAAREPLRPAVAPTEA